MLMTHVVSHLYKYSYLIVLDLQLHFNAHGRMEDSPFNKPFGEFPSAV